MSLCRTYCTRAASQATVGGAELPPLCSPQRCAQQAGGSVAVAHGAPHPSHSKQPCIGSTSGQHRVNIGSASRQHRVSIVSVSRRHRQNLSLAAAPSTTDTAWASSGVLPRGERLGPACETAALFRVGEASRLRLGSDLVRSWRGLRGEPGDGLLHRARRSSACDARKAAGRAATALV